MKYLKKYMEGDEDARNILIERNLRLVAHVCKKYNIPNVDNEDLISIGTIGLIKGINTFNTDKGVRLATYAARCIENEILMHLRSIKKLGAEVYLNEPIGKDKDDNEIALIDILENDEKNIEDEIDLKIEMLECHESQLVWMREHDGIDFADMVRTCSRYRGYQCGADYAEGFKLCKAYLKGTAKRLLP